MQSEVLSFVESGLGLVGLAIAPTLVTLTV